MHPISALWKANLIAFVSSFCVMVIELIAARILAPYIGVSLYTWTSVIGIILTGIALGNYLGGKIADKYASPLVLMTILFAGSLATIAILPATKLFASADWFSNFPLMANFVMKTTCIFFVPAIILSMVSPMVIKLTLADLGKTGGVVGNICLFYRRRHSWHFHDRFLFDPLVWHENDCLARSCSVDTDRDKLVALLDYA